MRFERGVLMSTMFQKSIATVSVIALMTGPIGTSVAAAQERVEVGNAAAVVGDVTMRVNGEGDQEDVERKDRFAWGDLLVILNGIYTSF